MNEWILEVFNSMRVSVVIRFNSIILRNARLSYIGQSGDDDTLMMI